MADGSEVIEGEAREVTNETKEDKAPSHKLESDTDKLKRIQRAQARSDAAKRVAEESPKRLEEGESPPVITDAQTQGAPGGPGSTIDDDPYPDLETNNVRVLMNQKGFSLSINGDGKKDIVIGQQQGSVTIPWSYVPRVMSELRQLLNAYIKRESGEE